MLYQLNEHGICASTGSACTSGSLEPSHVLRAMKVPFTAVHGSVRFSLSRYNTDEDVDRDPRGLPADRRQPAAALSLLGPGPRTAPARGRGHDAGSLTPLRPCHSGNPRAPDTRRCPIRPRAPHPTMGRPWGSEVEPLLIGSRAATSESARGAHPGHAAAHRSSARLERVPRDPPESGRASRRSRRGRAGRPRASAASTRNRPRAPARRPKTPRSVGPERLRSAVSSEWQA